jgi:hypothetical protein
VVPIKCCFCNVVGHFGVAPHSLGRRRQLAPRIGHVYLGVVPTGLIKTNPVLVDGNKTLHTGDKTSDSSEHMLVAVFRKPNNERVVNATVIARVGAKKWLGGIKVEKPLEKMLTSGVVTYGNYFSIPKKGKYEIEVRISEPNKDQTEAVTFVYNKF